MRLGVESESRLRAGELQAFPVHREESSEVEASDFRHPFYSKKMSHGGLRKNNQRRCYGPLAVPPSWLLHPTIEEALGSFGESRGPGVPL